MSKRVIVGLVALTVLMAVTWATAAQIDNEYVYAVQKALDNHYNLLEMIRWHQQDVSHAVQELGYREPTTAEAIKLLCLVGAIDMPYESPLWAEEETPLSKARPMPPQITVGKVDGSNAFDLIWANSDADSAKNAISDIATTSPSNDLDNDGKPEIVVTCKKYTTASPPYDYVSRVVVFENTADNTFNQVWYHDFAQNYADTADTQHTRATRLELGDLDGDGDLDIICGVYCQTFAKTDFGCIRVFAWDGVNGSDNYGTQPASTYDLNISGRQWCTALAVGNIDDDANLEVVVGENRFNYGYVLDITGTLGGVVTWNQEYCDSIGAGSPYAATVGDADGDGAMEFYITRWYDLRLHTYEYDSVGDSIISYPYIQVETSGDHYSWEGTKLANFDGDSYSEVYITSRSGNLWVITNTGDVSTATKHLLYTAPNSMYGLSVGDQDHGPGSDGGDLYCVSSTKVYDFEYTGTHVDSGSSYTQYTIFENLATNMLMVGIGDSLDLDGEHEVVAGQDEWSDTTRVVFVLEHGEYAAHDVGVQAISPTYTTVGQSDIVATVRNFGANDEYNIDVHWMTDTGDADSTVIDTLLSLQQKDIDVGWTADTTGLVTITAWTELASDEIASNDTSDQVIYVYPPETSQYTYTYTTESAQRVRGIAVFGNDDYVQGVTYSANFYLEFYHNAPGPPDITVSQWSDIDTTIDMWYNWGIGIDTLNNVYLCNQSPDLSAQALVFDYYGDEVDFLKLGYSDKESGKGTTYPTALDVDVNGYVYVAWYLPDTSLHYNVEIYPPISNWVNHQASPVTTFNAFTGDVSEGLCVNSDGSVMWVTKRSAGPPNFGSVTRWTGSPVGGYTQDATFAGDGSMELPGYVRGIDLAPDGDIYVCSDDWSRDLEKVYIADGTTGQLKYTIDIDSPGSYHRSPYDVEFSFVGGIDAQIQKSEGDIYLSWSAPGAATALYVTHLYGWYVDKWEGAGFKGIKEYNVYRSTEPDFVPAAGNLVHTTTNTYYLDVGAAGNTAVNYFYIVKSAGTPGYSSNSVTLGEYDKDLGNVK